MALDVDNQKKVTGMQSVKKFRYSMIAVLVLAFCAGGAHAEVDGDALGFTVAQDYSYDSNVFRVRDGQNPTGYAQRDDTILTTRANVFLDKVFGRQRLNASLGANHASYTDFSHLNNTGTSIQAGWRLGFGAASELGLSYNRNHYLGSFEDRTGYTENNMVTSESIAADTSLRVAGDWLGVASVSKGSFDNSKESLKSGDSDVLSYDGGVRYAPRTGNYVDLRMRKSEYEYNRLPGRSNYDYEQTELRLTGRWLPTGVSTVEPGVALVRSEHDVLTNLDFTGITWFFNYKWKPTGALETSLRASREVGAVGDAWGSYAKTYGLSSYTRWQTTSKLGLYLDLNYKKQDFEGYQNLTGSTLGDDRRDKIWRAKLGSDFLVTQKLTLGASLLLTRRISSVSDYAYTFGDKQAVLSAQYRF